MSNQLVENALVTQKFIDHLVQTTKEDEVKMFIQMLKNRICFDNTEGRGCDHQLCYGLENLIYDLKNGATK